MEPEEVPLINPSFGELLSSYELGCEEIAQIVDFFDRREKDGFMRSKIIDGPAIYSRDLWAKMLQAEVRCYWLR